ncbi:hypothetical protein Q8A73_021033 [Channa argus]|nr:hypothetical protein Q8A73_021033 [Channa argus]
MGLFTFHIIPHTSLTLKTPTPHQPENPRTTTPLAERLRILRGLWRSGDGQDISEPVLPFLLLSTASCMSPLCADLPHSEKPLRILSLIEDLMPKTLEGQITMEKTPSYFVTREAPARISAMSRDTKLIVVVRDPVTRAISDYTQTLSKKPDIPSFESLTFKNRTTGLIDTSWSAIQIGIYAKHLDNWLQYFPMDQILFVSGERLISDPAGELGRVQDFLGLKRIITDKHFYFNQTKGFPCLKKAEGSSKPHCLGKTKGRTHPNIDPEVVQRLRDFYRPFNMKFYQMTGQFFAWDD